MRQNRSALSGVLSRSNYMNQTPGPQDPATAPPMLDEADIGSGEKTPGQKETDESIRKIPPKPPAGPRDDADGAGKSNPAR
jgi:hypothetical protein